MLLDDGLHSVESPFDDVATSSSADVPRFVQTRGVTWVIKWFAATATLFSSTAMLVEFGYSLRAEQSLARAARAGALEATLPRANLATVRQSVWRRLDGFDLAPHDLRLRLEQNSTLVRGRLIAREGDRFSISLAVPRDAYLPAWLRAATLPWSDMALTARADREIPGAALH